jgi:integrase
VRSITKAQCRDYKDALLKLPNRLTNAQRKLGVLKVIEQTPEDVPRLSAKAVNKSIAAVHSILEYAVANDYAAANPMKRVKAIATDSGEDRRLPYLPSHLKTIFTSNLFTNGPRKPEERNADFWLPLLGLFTGARLEELGAASVSDVKIEGGITYLDITTIERSLKTQGSKRRVPVHQEVIRCGFLAYVGALRKRGQTKLFPDVKRMPGAKGAQTAAWSKKYGRWLDKIGITDARYVFHSFRHTFKEACRVADIREEIHDALTGHSNGSIGREYGGYPLSHLGENVAKISYPVDLKSLYSCAEFR